MPMHPSAPEDFVGVVDAYAHTAQAVVDLTLTLSEADFARETECAGWTVKDIVSHLTSDTLTHLGRPDPLVDVPAYPWISDDAGRARENGVELRRPRAGADIVAEYSRVTGERVGRLRQPDLTEDMVVSGPTGDTTLGAAVRRQAVDTWCHEQDIRGALHRPGDLDSPAAALWVARVVDRLPQIVVERAQVEPGKVVMIELTGPIQVRAGVRVELDEAGHPAGRPMFSRGVDETGPIPSLSRTTSIQMATEPFARRAAGRRSVDDLHYTVHGDAETARAVLEALPIST